MKLDGNVSAVVTGAASGLGEATARAFAARGVKVAVFDRDATKGEKVAGEIEYASQPSQRWWKTSCTHPPPCCSAAVT